MCHHICDHVRAIFLFDNCVSALVVLVGITCFIGDAHYVHLAMSRAVILLNSLVCSDGGRSCESTQLRICNNYSF